ncbi:hypothetical protein [Iamia sp.]|uniref:hypothetical protein n=1 Tax=Iamia sp. TaxID=2722710 RepID=UPI002D142386|nr:hypothetical protein [Iamia sp.]HXH58616.1 hypothetical protein [Iamia sp.]
MTVIATTEVASPYPIVTEVELPEVADLVRRSHEQQWQPLADIPWHTFDDVEINDEVRAAAATFWSLRAWMEHGAVPYGAERLRQAIAEHRPYEVKAHLVNFIREETRHFEASYLVAERFGGFQPGPTESYFEAIIPRFHDEREEQELSFYANLFLNTLFESLSGDLLQDRYRNAVVPAIKEVNKLILADEGRHIRFGKILMQHKLDDITDLERRSIESKFEAKLRTSLLRGVYAVTNLPDDMQQVAGQARRLTAQHGLGATDPDDEPTILRNALRRLRREVAPLDIRLPHFPEIGDHPDDTTTPGPPPGDRR